MTSPSSSSTSLSTPCVLGCCGPMFTVIVSVLISAIDSARSVMLPTASCLLLVSALDSIAFDIRPELFLADFERFVGLRRLPDLHRVVLASGMPFPILGHQQPAQVAVVVEDDAEHVPHFALGPSGAAPHALHRR